MESGSEFLQQVPVGLHHWSGTGQQYRLDHGKPVAIFSLEMSSVQLVNRLIAAEAEIDSEKIRKGTLAPHEWSLLHIYVHPRLETPTYTDDTPALSIL